MKIDPKCLESITSHLLEKGVNLSLKQVCGVADFIKSEILYGYASRLITQAEEIFSIDPGLTERRSSTL